MPSSPTRPNSPATTCWTSRRALNLRRSHAVRRMFQPRFRARFYRSQFSAVDSWIVFRRVCSAAQQHFGPNRAIVASRAWELVHGLSAVDARTLNTEELKMKKIVLALTAVAAFTGSAFAADLAARPYTKAPMPVQWLRAGPASTFSAAPAAACGLPISTSRPPWRGHPLAHRSAQGGSGWFGTVGAGYDWQFNGSWVAGMFADGQFGSIKGTIQDTVRRLHRHREDPGHLGGRCAPRLSGGSECPVLRQRRLHRLALVGHELDQHGQRCCAVASTPTRFNRNGWFVGGGVENNLNIFGITAPGWFMKTEYRCGLSTTPRTSPSSRRDQLPTGRDIRSTTGTRPSAPRWSIASTGPARSSRSTDLIFHL